MKSEEPKDISSPSTVIPGLPGVRVWPAMRMLSDTKVNVSEPTIRSKGGIVVKGLEAVVVGIGVVGGEVGVEVVVEEALRTVPPICPKPFNINSPMPILDATAGFVAAPVAQSSVFVPITKMEKPSDMIFPSTVRAGLPGVRVWSSTTTALDRTANVSRILLAGVYVGLGAEVSTLSSICQAF